MQNSFTRIFLHWDISSSTEQDTYCWYTVCLHCIMYWPTRHIETAVNSASSPHRIVLGLLQCYLPVMHHVLASNMQRQQVQLSLLPLQESLLNPWVTFLSFWLMAMAKQYSSSWERHLRATEHHLHMESHSVTRYPTQVNGPHHNSSETGRYSIYLPQRDGRLSWLYCWLYTKMVYLCRDSHPSKY